MSTRQLILLRRTAGTLPSFGSVRNGLLQRKCACGGTPGPSGECAECRRKRLQRKVAQPSTLNHQHSEVPPIVHEVLRSPGQPLDAAARAFMEPRFEHDFCSVPATAAQRASYELTIGPADDLFEREADRAADRVMRAPTQTARGGHDFSMVRVHTDARAAASAQALDALAYTFGSDIVFASGQYAPETESGRKLLAHELAHTIQQSTGDVGSIDRLQRAVRFKADFTNVTLSKGTAATITGHTFNYRDASFAADAEVRAHGDAAAELAEWDVGILQDEVGGWERYYWLRDNADRRGRFVEKKFLGGDARRRDQQAGATTEWDADSEHTPLSTVPPVAAGGGFEASTTVQTSDDPAGPDTTDGTAVTSMDATDGNLNIRTFRSGGRFQTWISAHNNTTGEWRHLRWINWNYMHSLDFTGTAATLAVGPESWNVGRFGPHTGGAAPLLAGDTANTVYNDASHWSFRRVNSWT